MSEEGAGRAWVDEEAERGGLSRKQVWQQRVSLGILCLRVLASCIEGSNDDALAFNMAPAEGDFLLHPLPAKKG